MSTKGVKKGRHWGLVLLFYVLGVIPAVGFPAIEGEQGVPEPHNLTQAREDGVRQVLICTKAWKGQVPKDGQMPSNAFSALLESSGPGCFTEGLVPEVLGGGRADSSSAKVVCWSPHLYLPFHRIWALEPQSLNEPQTRETLCAQQSMHILVFPFIQQDLPCLNVVNQLLEAGKTLENVCMNKEI